MENLTWLTSDLCPGGISLGQREEGEAGSVLAQEGFPAMYSQGPERVGVAAARWRGGGGADGRAQGLAWGLGRCPWGGW